MNGKRHFTTRRGFVAAAGFGLVSLYLVWAGYGAAPLGFGGHAEEEEGGHGHGGHGDAPSGPSREEFRALAQAFAEQHKLPDGSVKPARVQETPTDVYIMAMQWGYVPAVLRLEPGVRYRFRMMAMDIAHGASVQLGPAARMIRLRPGAMVEQEMTFAKAGEHLVYCTVYCGLPHDRMQGRIIVAERGATR